MSRRVLPSRSTRGARPVQSTEQENKDNELYAKMFGNDLDDDEDFIIRQAKENARRERTLSNLQKYSYARGYTYCFDLDLFPRLPNHPSYAIDQTNIFASTYSREQKLYKDSHLGSILNRLYFGLPYTEHDSKRSDEPKTKNICHYYLFENEDKKYNLDRILIVYKKIHKHLETFLKNGKIKQFSVLKRDPELDQIVKSDRELSEKLEALSKKIKILEERKASNKNNWYYEDELFYYHSLNQELHEKIEFLKDEIKPWRIREILCDHETTLRTLILDHVENAERFLTSALTYFNSSQIAVSVEMMARLSQKYGRKMLALIDDEPAVLFPAQIFHFGSHRLLETLNTVLSTQIQNESEANYYTAKFAWRKLFKTELLPNKLEKLKIEDSTALAKKLVEESKYFYKKQIIPEAQNQILDHMINLEGLEQPSSIKRVSLFRDSQTVEIHSKELMIIILYSWICKAFQELLPFADKYGEEFLQFVTCELFDKYSHGLVEAIGKPIVGTIRSNIVFLCELLGKIEPLGEFDFSLHFQYDKQRNVGILLRKKPEEDAWQTQKEDEENDNDEIEDSPTKKIKQNE